MKVLNLARRPFRNERLPTLILSVSLVLLLVLSARHAIAVRELRPGGTRDVERELLAAEQELRTLRADSQKAGSIDVPESKVQEWNAIRDLVDRRAFSWTGLFAALEAALPPGIRLVSVSPTSATGPILINLVAVGRTVDDALALPKALEAQGEFERALLGGYSETERGVEIQCTVQYVGRRAARGGSR